jgi:hypothetical protein
MPRDLTAPSRDTSSARLERRGLKLRLYKRGSAGPSSWWYPAAASLLVVPLALTGCGRAPASATSPGGETHAEVSAPAEESQTAATAPSEPSQSATRVQVKLVAINQDIKRADNYAFELHMALAYRHATEDVTVANPGETTAVMPGVDFSGKIVNKTPRRELPLNAIDLTAQLVYAADSPVCTVGIGSQKIGSWKYDNGTCGVTAGMISFGSLGSNSLLSTTVPPDGESSPAGLRYFDVRQGFNATDIRVSGIPDDGKFETYATALDHPIGMVAVANDDAASFDLPVLCTVKSTVSGTSDAIVAQSSGNPVCS